MQWICYLNPTFKWNARFHSNFFSFFIFGGVLQLSVTNYLFVIVCKQQMIVCLRFISKCHKYIFHMTDMSSRDVVLLKLGLNEVFFCREVGFTRLRLSSQVAVYLLFIIYVGEILWREQKGSSGL